MQEEETQVSTLECKNHFITIYNLCVVCDKVEWMQWVSEKLVIKMVQIHLSLPPLILFFIFNELYLPPFDTLSSMMSETFSTKIFY